MLIPGRHLPKGTRKRRSTGRIQLFGSRPKAKVVLDFNDHIPDDNRRVPLGVVGDIARHIFARIFWGLRRHFYGI